MTHRRCSGAFQWTMIALATGVAAALVEVLVRFSLAKEELTIDQLAVAVSANIAVLGVISVVIFSVAWVLAGLLTRSTAGVRRDANPLVASTLVAILAVFVIVGTDFFGLRSDCPVPLSACALSGGVLAAMIAVWPKRISDRVIRRPIALAIALTWVASAVAGGAAYARSAACVKAWVQAPPQATRSAPTDRPNIIVIVLDTLRADRVGVYSGRNLTPNLDKLAESSIVYTHAISTAPWTLPSHASLFTGLYPDEHGVSWGHYGLDDRFDTLAELLRDTGYETFAISNNFMLNDPDGYGQGFDAFVDTPNDPALTQWRLAMKCRTIATLAGWFGVPSVVAEDAGSGWTNWLLQHRLERHTATGRPFFAFLNYFEVHDPYYPPAEFRKSRLGPLQQAAYSTFVQRREDLISQACGPGDALTDDDIELMSALYDAEVAYQDHVVGETLRMFDRAGALDNAWLVVLADHGELFGEDGMVFHTAGAHYKLLHVPLIVRPPGGVDPRRVDAPVQPVDVFATLVEKAGASMPKAVRRAYPLPLSPVEDGRRKICVAQTYGASLIGLAIAQLQSRTTDYSHWMTWVTTVVADDYLLEFDAGRPHALFPVRSEERPEDNLLETRPDLVRTMADQYQRWTEQTQPGDRS